MQIYSHLEFGPILRSLNRHKFSSLLVILQMAVAMAIMTNGIFIAAERYQLVQRHSGMDEENSFYVTSSGFTDNFNPRVSIEQDLALIRNMPGVINAVQTNSLPLSGSGKWFNLQIESGTEEQKIQTAGYKFDQHGIQTFDLELLAGENFAAHDVLWQDPSDNSWPAKIMLTKATAQALFGKQDWISAIGKTIYVDGSIPLVVTALVDHLQGPWIESEFVNNVMISPVRVTHTSARYVIRSESERRDELMKEVESALVNSNKQRMVRKLRSLEASKLEIYAADFATVSILLIVVVVLTLVAAMGIAGLASFNINKRKRQIGVRRALGASRGDILRYFLLENFLLSGLGVLLGSVLAVSLNMFLVNFYGITPLSWFYIPAALITLLLIGQLAVFLPACKAASISPAMAVRAV
ncbi:MAG: putative ABC transport system permease protein [Paraglaciecola sp.]|jgi:putative ABC transport system permease protein